MEIPVARSHIVHLMAQTTKERQAAWYVANREKVITKATAWQAANPEKARAASAKWRSANPEKARACDAAWLAANPAKNCAKQVRRIAVKLNATPKWLTPEHHAEILNWYRRGAEAGLEVDHVVPLRGVNVSGLHVPWNMQLLTKSENVLKSNHFI